MAPAENKDEVGNDSESKIANVLPEGFFDDPVIDAKVGYIFTLIGIIYTTCCCFIKYHSINSF